MFKSLVKVLLTREQISLLKLQRSVAMIDGNSSESDMGDQATEDKRLIDWLISKEEDEGPLVLTGKSRFTQMLAAGVYESIKPEDRQRRY